MDHQSTFTEWITQYDKLIRHIINGFEAKPALQEELFQEIALNIWRALPSFKGQSQVKTFVARIAHNVLATHVAKAVKTVKTVAVEQLQDQGEMPLQSNATGAEVNQYTGLQAKSNVPDANAPVQGGSLHATPYQALDQKQRQQRLAAAIRELSLEQQQVITLALEGMSYQDIADSLAISVNLVGVRLTRAKSQLAEKLGAK